MKKATLCFLLKNNQILLGMKKRGFGTGLWNGCGGKVHEEEGETVEQAAIRETKEEFCVDIKDIRVMGELEFTFEDKPEWGQNVYVFTCIKWTGEIQESEEMRPEWFDIKQIPYDKMWPDDPFWLPKIIDGEKVKMSFVFGTDGKIKSQTAYK